jgi:hypothetical protein
MQLLVNHIEDKIFSNIQKSIGIECQLQLQIRHFERTVNKQTINIFINAPAKTSGNERKIYTIYINDRFIQ